MQSRVAFKDWKEWQKLYYSQEAWCRCIYRLDAPANEEVACLSLRYLPSKYFFAGQVLPCLPTLSKYLEKY